MAKAYLVIRIKGQADVPYWANTTLRLLKLEKKYRATILPIKENTEGMLKKIQHYVSWQEIDMSTTKELLDKKGRRSGYKKITAETIEILPPWLTDKINIKQDPILPLKFNVDISKRAVRYFMQVIDYNLQNMHYTTQLYFMKVQEIVSTSMDKSLI